jgi:hypothetical protein
MNPERKNKMKNIEKLVRDYETGQTYMRPFVVFYNGVTIRSEKVRDIQTRRLLRRAVINKHTTLNKG